MSGPEMPPALPGDAEAADLVNLSANDAVARMVRGELDVERYATALLERCAAGRQGAAGRRRNRARQDEPA